MAAALTGLTLGAALLWWPPTPPEAAGDFRRLVLDEQFDSLDPIDLTGSGDDEKTWFTDRPFGWGRTAPQALSVTDGVLTIEETTSTPNHSIATSSPTGAGRGFHYGYFEASIAFDPADAPESAGWPAFWGLSHAQITGAGLDRVPELDFFEAYHEPHQPFENLYAGTVHEVLPGPPEESVSNHGANTAVFDEVDWAQFHTYGTRWEPGLITWYFDDQPVHTLAYSADAEPHPNPGGLPAGTFSSLDTDTDGLAVILGTDVGFPMQVDWVRVWQ